MPPDAMIGAAGREPAPEQAASVADIIRASTSLEFFMMASVGFGVLHLDIRTSDQQYSFKCKIYPPATPSRHSEVTSAARRVQRVASVTGFRVLRSGIDAAQHLQPGTGNPPEQVCPASAGRGVSNRSEMISQPAAGRH